MRERRQWRNRRDRSLTPQRVRDIACLCGRVRDPSLPLMTQIADVLTQLKAHGSEANRAGMARFGINTEHALGVSVTLLRTLGRPHRNDHALALALWKSGIHEARILASIVDDPAQVTARQMEQWVKAFDSWDLCDQCCSSLFSHTPFAYDKAAAWS